MKALNTFNQDYVAPSIDVCEVAVEEGFTISPVIENTTWEETEEEFY